MSAKCQKRTWACLFDHLVSAGEQCGWNGETKSLCRRQIDCQVEFVWRLNRQIGWPLALEDAVDVAGRAAVLVDRSGPYEIRPPLVTKKRAG